MKRISSLLWRAYPHCALPAASSYANLRQHHQDRRADHVRRLSDITIEGQRRHADGGRRLPEDGTRRHEGGSGLRRSSRTSPTSARRSRVNGSTGRVSTSSPTCRTPRCSSPSRTAQDKNQVGLFPGGHGPADQRRLPHPTISSSGCGTPIFQVAGIANYLTKPGTKWFLVTADYALGHQLRADAKTLVGEDGVCRLRPSCLSKPSTSRLSSC